MKKVNFIPTKVKNYRVNCWCGMALHKSGTSKEHIKKRMINEHPELSYSDIEEV